MRTPARRHRLLLGVLLAGTLGLGIASAARAATLLPPPGRIFTGVAGGIDSTGYLTFAIDSGHAPAVWQLFLTWDQDRGENPYQYLAVRLSDAAALRTRLMIHLTTARRDGSEFLSPRALARGRGDRYLLRIAATIAASAQGSASGEGVYVRPFGEMNQGDHVYSAIGRGRSHRPGWFRRAFRRTVLILRGGRVARIDRRLRRNRLPPVRTRARTLPRAKVAIVWTPQVSPDAWRYWPGPGYVDWVGTDFYSGYPNWSGLERFYRETARTRKPFVLGEFGIYHSGDDPDFITRLMSWARHHRRVRMALYYQGNEIPGPFALSALPGTRRALRSAWFARPFLDSPAS